MVVCAFTPELVSMARESARKGVEISLTKCAGDPNLYKYEGTRHYVDIHECAEYEWSAHTHPRGRPGASLIDLEVMHAKRIPRVCIIQPERVEMTCYGISGGEWPGRFWDFLDRLEVARCAQRG